jgi:hypothetical protein
MGENGSDSNGVLTLFDRTRRGFSWDSLPRSLQGPTIATVDDSSGYHEYHSTEAIPLDFRRRTRNSSLVSFIYYAIDPEVDSIVFRLRAKVSIKGVVFYSDTTLSLKRHLYEVPLMVH